MGNSFPSIIFFIYIFIPNYKRLSILPVIEKPHCAQKLNSANAHIKQICIRSQRYRSGAILMRAEFAGGMFMNPFERRGAMVAGDSMQNFDPNIRFGIDNSLGVK